MSSFQQQNKAKEQKTPTSHCVRTVSWWPGIKEVLREDTGRLYELFAAVFTVDETEDIPFAHGETQQAETEVIIREFMV